MSTLVDHAEQQQLFLSELKRVGTQQEQLKKAVSEAIALADAQGTTLEIAHLNSFPANTNLQMQHLDSRKSVAQDQQQQSPTGKPFSAYTAACTLHLCYSAPCDDVRRKKVATSVCV